MTCATPAKLKILFLPTLCTQQPTRAASTVIAMIARPRDRKKYEAFQQPGNTVEAVAKPSTLKLAQCVFPCSLMQRLKIPTVGTYSSDPFSARGNKCPLLGNVCWFFI